MTAFLFIYSFFLNVSNKTSNEIGFICFTTRPSLLGLLASEFFILRSQGAFPPGFYLLREGWVYRPAPEAPLIRGMPTGSEAFLEMPGACGLRPCAWPHPKKGLVPYSSGWWDGGQIPSGIRAGRVIETKSRLGAE